MTLFGIQVGVGVQLPSQSIFSLICFPTVYQREPPHRLTLIYVTLTICFINGENNIYTFKTAFLHTCLSMCYLLSLPPVSSMLAILTTFFALLPCRLHIYICTVKRLGAIPILGTPATPCPAALAPPPLAVQNPAMMATSLEWYLGAAQHHRQPHHR